MSSLLTSVMICLLRNINYGRCCVSVWQVQDAKARFSELLDDTLKKGPQVVTRRGVEAAVLVPIEEWRRLQSSARPVITTGGAAWDPQFTEGGVGHDYLLKKGIPDHALIAETHAVNTEESAGRVAVILR